MDHGTLLSNFSYCATTGVFKRLKPRGNTKAGSILGVLDKKGYLKALVLGQYVKLHRLAWFYVHGQWPTAQLDHINQSKTDNRIANLRECCASTNCTNQSGPRKNNQLGLQGVHRIEKTGRFRACYSIQGVKHHLGVFATAEEAAITYSNFKNQHLPTTS